MSSAPPPGRRRAGLNRQRVVEETLAMIDEQGLAAVTMRALAARLGVEAMSLYKHVANREALFDAVVTRVIAALAEGGAAPGGPAAGWRPYLTGMAREIRRRVVAHPNAFVLVVTRRPGPPWISPPLCSAEWVEALLAGLRREGFSDEQARYGYRALNRFLLGFLWLETSTLAATGAAEPYDAGRYPTLHELSGTLAEHRFDAEFEAGLQSTLDQIGAVLV
ncbi:MAG TPA: TetR/AcrR family transcriptional regulator C-terminal domain-containing protein [Jatrophihabitans sp.]|nr:TetR/AcrR family transcriptional regulator C-terminal domain-containing protein [Jatrophihabitans sp.]